MQARLAPGSRRLPQVSLKPEGPMQSPSPGEGEGQEHRPLPVTAKSLGGRQGWRRRLGCNGKGLQEPQCCIGKKKEKDVFFGRRGSKYCRLPWEIGGMDGMQMPHGLFESAGDDQSNATAAGGFSEGKTGGFGSFRCMGGDTGCQLHARAPPQTPPHPWNSWALLPCARCPLPGDREPRFIKIW